MQKLAEDHPESPDYPHIEGGVLQNLAEVDLGAKRFQEACERLREAIVRQKKALAGHPKNPEYRQFLAMHLACLANAARGLGRADEAIEAERELSALTASDPASWPSTPDWPLCSRGRRRRTTQSAGAGPAGL